MRAGSTVICRSSGPIRWDTFTGPVDGRRGGRRRVARERAGDAEHDEDEQHLGAQRAAQEAARVAGGRAAGGEAAEGRHDPLAVDRAEPDQDR